MPGVTELPGICVVMALREEAGRLFEQSAVPVLYSGVGKINAAHALTRVLASYRHASIAPPLVVNFGTAGSRSLPHGTMVGCHEFVQRDMDVRALGVALGVTPFDDLPHRLQFDRIFPQLVAGVCGSGDSFAMSASELACDLLDMEAYALAKVCHLEGARFACAKYITDGADTDSARHWRGRVGDAAVGFFNLFRQLQAVARDV